MLEAEGGVSRGLAWGFPPFPPPSKGNPLIVAVAPIDRLPFILSNTNHKSINVHWLSSTLRVIQQELNLIKIKSAKKYINPMSSEYIRKTLRKINA